MPDQHAALAEERSARYTRNQELLMIANGMHRATAVVLCERGAGVT
jgi:hypothetical protein